MEIVNKYKNNPKYINKSQITSKWLKSKGLNYVTVNEARQIFDSCEYELGLAGHPYIEAYRKHTHYVVVSDLIEKIKTTSHQLGMRKWRDFY